MNKPQKSEAGSQESEEKKSQKSAVPDFFSLHKFDRAFILPSHTNALVFPLSALHDIYLPDGLRYRR